MNHTLKTMAVVAVVLVVLGPALVDVASRLVPLVLVIGVVVAGLRLLWFYTQRW